MGTAVFDPLVWLQQYTCTKDSHWKEAGADTPYRPFPDKPYFRFILDEIHRNKVLLIEKPALQEQRNPLSILRRR